MTQQVDGQISHIEYRDFDYDRTTIERGWTHFGMGGFARAFVADIANDIAVKGNSDLGLVAVFPTGDPKRGYEPLRDQENIFHLVRRNGHEIVQRVGVILDSFVGVNDGERIMQTLSLPETRLVSMTVTKDGYGMESHKPGRASPENDVPALRSKSWGDVKSVFGQLVGGLYQRYTKGEEPFVVMSFDNVPGNGKLVAGLLSQITQQLGDEGFTKYVDRVVIPNTVVDRITPDQDFSKEFPELLKNHEVNDNCAVLSERHRELVVDSPSRLPADIVEKFRSANVSFVEDISPYVERKLRVLNGGHKLIGMMGAVMGLDTVADVMRRPDTRAVFDAFQAELVESLPSTESMTVKEYGQKVIERFTNPHVSDVTSRLLTNTSGTLLERVVNVPGLEKGTSVEASAFAVAVWLRYMEGNRDTNSSHTKTYFIDERDTNAVAKAKLYPSTPNLVENLTQFLTSPITKNVPQERLTGFAARAVEIYKEMDGKDLADVISAHFTPGRPTGPSQAHLSLVANNG